jgi:hypothetical protein
MTNPSNSISDDELIRIALSAIGDFQQGVVLPPLGVLYVKRHMSLGKNRSGWVITFKLDVPSGFEPDLLFVEVYEDDLTTFIPRVL